MEDYDDEDDMDEYERQENQHEEDDDDEQMDVDESNMFPGMLRFGKSRTTPFAGNKEESKGPKKARTYLDRCKEVGRVGPKVTKLDPTSAMGTVKIFDESTNCCDVEGVS